MGPGMGPNLNISRDPETGGTAALGGITSGTATCCCAGAGVGLLFCLQATKPAPLSRPTFTARVVQLCFNKTRLKKANTKGGRGHECGHGTCGRRSSLRQLLDLADSLRAEIIVHDFVLGCFAPEPCCCSADLVKSSAVPW